MRLVICYISLLVTGFSLVGCGQSGTLHLPNDPNYDKRAQYLLYPNVDSKQQSEQKLASEQEKVSEQKEVTVPDTELN
jgi:predicted small lipoprotein YifL